jgi:hypothetical protein
MKISLSILAGALMLASGGAFAQTCANPIPMNGTGAVGVTGDTCAGANELGTLCIFGQSPSNDIIYSVTIAAPYTATSINLTNNTPAWNAALVLVQSACNGNSTCPRNADAGGPGASESLDVTGLTDGSYFLVVTSTTSDTTCGSYGVAVVGGNLPVTLQSFDVS